jgi:hypothetical protein
MFASNPACGLAKKSATLLAILLFPVAAYAHIRVDVPVGGEELVAGDTFEIFWDAYQYHGPGTITIEFSSNGGEDYTVIEPSIALNSFYDTVGSYSWTVPEVTSTDCRIKAFYAVTDSSNYYDDESPAFTVKEFAGDVNVDGGLDAVDVQLVINEVLGLDIGGLDADANNDSTTDAQDIQLIINGALGLTK